MKNHSQRLQGATITINGVDHDVDVTPRYEPLTFGQLCGFLLFFIPICMFYSCGTKQPSPSTAVSSLMPVAKGKVINNSNIKQAILEAQTKSKSNR